MLTAKLSGLGNLNLENFTVVPNAAAAPYRQLCDKRHTAGRASIRVGPRVHFFCESPIFRDTVITSAEVSNRG